MREPYPEKRLHGFTRVDGTVWFYTRVNALLRPEFTVLDIGCGRGAAACDAVEYRRNLVTLRGRCARVIGIDVSPDAESNPLVDEFRRIDGAGWPVESATVDLAVSDWVVEHVESPHHFFSECARILKPGGTLCLRTPNVHGYPALAARLIPERWHARILRSAQPNRSDEDVFPGVYRCNTRSELERALAHAGFEPFVIGYEAEPAYLGFSQTAYRIGAALNRFVPEPFRATLLVFARKPTTGGAVVHDAPVS